MKISKQNAFKYSRTGLDGTYYQLPEINGGTTVVYAEFTGEHGERTIGDRARIYYLLEGEAEFLINGERFLAQKDDVVPIPPNATYNLWPKKGPVKVILFMELLDISKLQNK